MSGQIQTLATPPPVSVQTLLYNIYLAAASGGSGGASWGSITGTLSAQTDLQSALDTKLNLAGGTMTGALVNSTNGAASTPALKLTGSLFTGGTGTTTKPLFLIEPTGTTSTGWNTSGTMLGVNAASGFAGNLFDFQVNGASKFAIGPTGDIVATANYMTVSGSFAIGPYSGSGGGYVSFFNNAPSAGRFSYFDSDAYFSGGYRVLFANARNDAFDCGLKWGAAGVVKVTNATTGRGTLDAAGYQVGGVAGAAGGTFTAITSITVVNGIITEISGT